MTSVPLEQFDGLPSVAALEAMDATIAAAREATRSLFSDVAWNSFGNPTAVQDGYDELAPLHTGLAEIVDQLQQIRDRFVIREIPPTKPVREVVRV